MGIRRSHRDLWFFGDVSHEDFYKTLIPNFKKEAIKFPVGTELGMMRVHMFS